MKTKLVLWLLLFSSLSIFCQGEAALPWLYLHPVSPSIGKGLTGVSNMEMDPLNWYYNPAKLAEFEGDRSFSFLFMPERADWGIYGNTKYSSYGVKVGMDISNYFNGIPLKLGIGFIRNSLDYGEFYVTSWESPDGMKTNPVDAANNLGIGIGLDYKIRFSLGLTAKNYNSDFGSTYINGALKDIEADGFAFDFGAFFYAPLSDLLFYDYNVRIDDHSYLKPLMDVSCGYSLLNVGGKVKYPYLEGEDPLPRNARLGYSFNLGINMNIREIELNFMKYGFTAEADDILVQRNPDYTGYEYDNIFGKISIGKHLLGLNSDQEVAVHKGHSFSLFETVTVNSGIYDGRGYNNIKTNSYGISSRGISKLLDMLIENNIVNWVTRHVVVEYYNINMFVDTGLESNLKGISITLRNLWFN